MKKNLYIFGDSYFTDYQKEVSWPTYTTMLKTNYNVFNYAESGTGLEWSLKKLLEILSTTDAITLKNSYLIFGLGSHYRFNFAFVDPSKQNFFGIEHYKLFNRSNWQTIHDVLPPKQWIKKFLNKANIEQDYEFYKKFIIDYIENITYGETELDKTICYLINLLENKFEKIFLFPIFYSPKLEYKNIPKNIYINNFLLSNIDWLHPREDINRVNHMSENTHKIFYNALYNLIEHNFVMMKKQFPTYRKISKN